MFCTSTLDDRCLAMAYGVRSASALRAMKASVLTMRAATRMLTAVASVSHAVMCMRGTSIKGRGTRQWKPWR